MKKFVSKTQKFSRFTHDLSKFLETRIVRDIENNDVDSFKRHCLKDKFDKLYDIRESYTFRFREYGNVRMGGMLFYYGFQDLEPKKSYYFYDNNFEGEEKTTEYQPSLTGPFYGSETEELPPYYKFTWGKEWNVLMLSVVNDSFSIFKYLVENGANLNLKTESDKSLADFIESREQKEKFYEILRETKKQIQWKALTMEQIKEFAKK